MRGPRGHAQFFLCAKLIFLIFLVSAYECDVMGNNVMLAAVQYGG